MNISKATFSIFKRDVIIYFLNFLTSIIISRKIGLTALGIWSILKLVYTYGETFGRSRAEFAAIYFIGNKKIDKGTAFISLNLILIFFILIIEFFAFSNYEYIYNLLFKNIDIIYKKEFLLTLISIPIQLTFITYSYFFIAIKDFNNFNKTTILNNLLLTIFSIGSLIFTSFQLKGLIFAYFIAPFISSIYSLYLF